MHMSRAFAFLCLVVSVGAQRNHSRLSCYLDVLTPSTREGSCTHIILPSVSSDDELYLQSLTEDDYHTIQRMKERNSALKILLGLEIKSSRLKLMSANEASVGSFIQTLLTYLKEKRLDGLNLIWLDGTPSDTELFTHFLKSLKGVFDEETRPLLLSASVKETTDKTVASYDEQTLSQYVDFISILPAQLQTDGQYISKIAQHWQDQQVDLQKLDLVMPGFLQRYHHRNHPKHDDTTAEEGKKDHVHVLNSYLGNQVCQAVKSGQEQFITLTSVSDGQSPVKEVLQQGFGGIGVVLIDLDVFGNSMCPNMTQKERATVESKAIMHSHHGHRRHGHGDHRHHHTGHHTRHHGRHHGRHHHGRHLHHHGHRPHHHGHRHHHHGRHHHHHHPHHHSTTTQSSVTSVTPKGME